MNPAPRTAFKPLNERGGAIFKLIVLLAVLALLFLLYLLRGPILREMGNLWIVDQPPVAADAILVLADDDYWGSRVQRAAELFHENVAPVVVASGHMLRPYAGTGDFMMHDLTERGVPAASIIVVKHQAADTQEESQALRAAVVAHGWKHVVVVTSNYHTRRARYIFTRVFPARITVDVAAARDPDFDPVNWWQRRAGLKSFAHELIGMVVAMWELRHMNPETGANSSEVRRPAFFLATSASSRPDLRTLRSFPVHPLCSPGPPCELS